MKKKDLELIMNEQRETIVRLRKELDDAKQDAEMWKSMFNDCAHNDALLEKFINKLKAEFTLLEGGSENLPAGAVHA